jgi:hypothetical protein
MTGLVAVRNAVAAKVEAVAGVGKVYRYLRLVDNEDAIAADMVADGRLHYWSISPAVADPLIRERHPCAHAKITYQFDVHAFYAFENSGETQEAFTDVVLAVINDFETGDKKLNGVVEVAECGPLQWRQCDERLLANVLCHHAAFGLRVVEHPD